jgi:hypothetical protein
MKYFHGYNKQHSYFEGWYLKQQTTTDAVAFIPAFHVDEHGYKKASLQVITNDKSHRIEYPISKFKYNKKHLSIRLGNNIFTERGCKLDCKTKGLYMKGNLDYGPFRKPMYDIMGPFRFVPIMECRHSVFSLTHAVNGTVIINDKEYTFHNHYGYMEGDRGQSFPKRYIWTQCNWRNHSIMVSIADIPFCGGSFIGCIGFVLYQGREYRIATYLGVKLLHLSENAFYISQGYLTLLVELLEENAKPLYAPIYGNMERTIHESITCKVQYTCTYKEKVIFRFISNQASYETSWR